MITKEINGKQFEVKRSKYYTEKEYIRLLTELTSLEQCYAKPSHMKQLIYYTWRNWFDELSTFIDVQFVQFCGVKSYNFNVFSLHGLLETDEHSYILVITSSHNYAYIVS